MTMTWTITEHGFRGDEDNSVPLVLLTGEETHGDNDYSVNKLEVFRSDNRGSAWLARIARNAEQPGSSKYDMTYEGSELIRLLRPEAIKAIKAGALVQALDTDDVESIFTNVGPFMFVGDTDGAHVAISLSHGDPQDDVPYTAIGLVPIETARAFAGQVTAMVSDRRSWKPLAAIVAVR